jgi:dihydrofolate reductase
VANNGVIGRDNDLIWHIREDMKFFKATTVGHIILMGRKNFESIPEKFRPLPDRLNCILTRNPSYQATNCELVGSIEEWIEKYKDDVRKSIIIGGGQVYQEAMDKDLVDELLITHVHASPEGDTFFPNIDPQKWTGQVIGSGEKNELNEYSYTITHYTRR